MNKEVQEKKKVVKRDSYEALKALFYSGKVKPSLNKMLVELENDPENVDLCLLACQCLVRTKGYDQLLACADTLIKLVPEDSEGYYYKGVAIQNKRGKEQDALKNFNQALTLDPENPVYLKSKATTHLSLYKDYDLPLTFAEKHRVKAETTLLKIIELVEQKENASYLDYLTLADVCILVSQNQNAKKYYIKAVDAFNASDETEQNMNIHKDIIKAQKACIKLTEKFTEGLT
ncbi:MAG: tetratricopeptide repeat protein [Cyclobacteriaceae bacterium]